jgi:orotidine-5'-phosphate decarboxylase
MNSPFSDRLVEAIAKKNAPVCVGFDPQIEFLPPSFAGQETHAATIEAFGVELIQCIAPLVPAIKINIAFFEPLGPEGIRAYFNLVKASHAAGLIVIGDVKRADIGHSAARYADAQLSGRGLSGLVKPDAVTINPYFGLDGVQPFLDVVRDEGRGVFVLVQTSNPSAAEVQGLILADGDTLCQRIAKMVQAWASDARLIGQCGYSGVGAVVSPRDIPSTERIRTLMPRCLFLVPGFGAQGRTAEEVARCFNADGTGAIVTASRSVIFAHREAKYHIRFGDDWKRCVQQACLDFVAEVRKVTHL